MVLVDQSTRRTGARPTSCGTSARSVTSGLCGEDAQTCTALEQGGLRITTTLDWEVQQVAEKWVAVAALAPHQKNPRAIRPGPRRAVPALDARLEDNERLERRALGHRLRDRRDHRLRRLGRLLRQAPGQASSSPSSTCSSTAGASPARRSSPSTTRPASTTADAHRVHRCSWTSRPTSAAATRPPTSTSSSAVPLRVAQRAPVLAQHPGRQGAGHHQRHRAPVRARRGVRAGLPAAAAQRRACRWRSARSRSIRSTSPTPTARSPTGPLHRPRRVDPLGHERGGRGRACRRYEVPGRRARSSRRRRRTSSPTSWRATPTPPRTPSGASMRITNDNGRRRPAALKTGTNNDAKDLVGVRLHRAAATARPHGSGEYALAVGVWTGNSDASPVERQREPGVLARRRGAALAGGHERGHRRLAHQRLRPARRPRHRDRRRVHRATSRRCSRASRSSELFIAGHRRPATIPTSRASRSCVGADGRGTAGSDGCDGRAAGRAGYLDARRRRSRPRGWNEANRGWIRRARRGAGVEGGPKDTAHRATSTTRPSSPTGSSWGAPFTPDHGRATRRPVAGAERGSVRVAQRRADRAEPTGRRPSRPRTHRARAAGADTDPSRPEPTPRARARADATDRSRDPTEPPEPTTDRGARGPTRRVARTAP